MDTKQLKEKLSQLIYPCYFIAHGAARDYRTKFRGEHPGVFGSALVYSPEEAFNLIDQQGYQGFYSEMNLIAISSVDGNLYEDIL